jgi:hypothetical protein
VAFSYLDGSGQQEDNEESAAAIEWIKTLGLEKAKAVALQEAQYELETAANDLNELKDKFGINYNKSDLSTVRSTIKKLNDENQSRLKEEGIEDNDVELPSIHR